jgi:hypothetical protein
VLALQWSILGKLLLFLQQDQCRMVMDWAELQRTLYPSPKFKETPPPAEHVPYAEAARRCLTEALRTLVITHGRGSPLVSALSALLDQASRDARLS